MMVDVTTLSFNMAKKFPTLYLSLFCYLLLLPIAVDAQSLDDAAALYENEEYEASLELLQELEQTDDVLLFTGKNYLALGEYLKSSHFLNLARNSQSDLISSEAYYSLAINEFHQGNLTRSLQILSDLASGPDRAGIRSSSRNFYHQILNYLSDRQRHQVFRSTNQIQIRYDLIRSAIGRTNYEMVEAMLSELEKLSGLQIEEQAVESLRNQLGPKENYVYSIPYSVRAPEGMIYRVGVALPSFDSDHPQFEITRNLYFGMVLAAEWFNERNTDRKVELRFGNTDADPDSIPGIFHQLYWNERVDALIGPLYSEEAAEMSRFAESFEIPMLTPLANSDEINLGHNYTFQVNPTFARHGERMARFAVEEAGLDTLAILVESGTLGRSSALAFRHEVERLGAHVEHYIEKDFAEMGYDISEVTEIFTTDTTLADSLGYVPIDGVYAPFTGQAASTLIQLLMTDLEAMQTDLLVLGSEEWREARYTDSQLRNFPIFYSQPYQSVTRGERTAAEIEVFPDQNDQNGLRRLQLDNTRENIFSTGFERRFGFEPDRFAKIGYDTAAFLLDALERAGNPDYLVRMIREAPLFQGEAIQIHFEQSQINRMVEVIPLTYRAEVMLYGPTTDETDESIED